MIQNTLYFQNADCMEKKEEKKCCAQKKNFKNKSVLCMEFAKWQIKVKKHDLGRTISWKYNVSCGLSKKQYRCFLYGEREISQIKEYKI